MLADLVKGVSHLGIPVCDLYESADWYIRMLGFEKTEEKSVFYPERMDMLFIRQRDLVIQLYRPAPHLMGQIEARDTGVIDHFALDAPDFTECATQVYHNGACLHESTPKGCVFYDHIGKQGVRGINFTGPNKEVVELCHDYNRSYGGETGLQGWSHLAIKISDLKTSLRFYEKLGFQKIMDGYLDTENGRMQIGFAACHGFTLELIQVTEADRPELKKKGPGRLDHVALAVTDAKKARFLAAKEKIRSIEPALRELAFSDGRVSYFTVSGPDGERIRLWERKTWKKQ